MHSWFAADAQIYSDASATTPITSGTVGTWRDIGFYQNEMTQNTTSNRPTLVDSSLNTTNLNYNPILEFDGDDRFLVDSDLNGTDGDGDLTDLTGTSDWDVFVVGFTDRNGSSINSLLSFGRGTDQGYTFTLQQTDEMSVRDNNGNYTALTGGNINGITNTEIYSWAHADTDPIGDIIPRIGLDTAVFDSEGSPNASTNVSGTAFSIGSNYISGSHTNLHRGSLAEVILYNQIKDGTLERERIVSYLALKYGLTLSSDYYSSDQTIIWDIGNTGGFDNRIFGLSRDTDSRLDQKIARSSLANSNIISLALTNDFISSNTSSSRTVSLEEDGFLLVGDNNASTEMGESNSNLSNTVTFRLSRMWKFAKNGINSTSNSLFIKFDVNEIDNIYARNESTASAYTLILTTSSDFSGTLDTYSPLSLSGDTLIFEVPINSIDDQDIMAIGYTPIGPGGEIANLHSWFKADVGTFSDREATSPTTSGELTTWRDQGLYQNDMTQATTNNKPSLVDSVGSITNLNFNPIVEFDGNDRFLVDVGLDDSGNDGVLTGLSDSSDWDLYIVGFSDRNGDIVSSLMSFGSGTDQGYNFTLQEDDQMSVRDNDGSNTASTGANINGLTNAEIYRWSHGINDPIGDIVLLTGFDTATIGGQSNEADITDVSGNSYSIGSNYISGSHNNNFSGSIAEIILYNQLKNGTLENEKILTYLALKYGIALSDDYYSSDETIVWDVGNTSGFDTGIFGIARDDSSKIDQKIARSASTGSLLTVSLDNNFSISNSDVSRTENLNDNSFLLLGDNDAIVRMEESNTNLSSIVEYRLSRMWKFQKTGIGSVSQNLYLQFDLNEIDGIYNLPQLSASDYTLILTENNDFSGTPKTYTGTSLTADFLVFTVPINSIDDDDIMTIGINPIGPGGEITNLLLWFKADVGTFSDREATTAIDLGAVTTWRDLGPFNNDMTQSANNNKPTLVNSNFSSNNINFNQIIEFDGGDRFLVDRGLDGADDDGILTGLTDSSDWDLFVVGYTNRNGNPQNSLFSFGSGTDQGYVFTLQENDQMSVRDNSGNYTANTGGNINGVNNAELYSWSHDINASLGSIIPRTGFDTASIRSQSNQNDITDVSGTSISIGSNYISGSHSNLHNGSIAEIILYSELKDGTLERSHILTYLALKYGISLSDDYYSSSDTLLWDIGNTGGFDTRIFGLSRDNNTFLNQKISQSNEETNSVLRIALQNIDSLPNNSASRTKSLINNGYILLGDNGENTNFIVAESNISNITRQRLNRYWRIETHDLGSSNDTLFLFFDGSSFTIPNISINSIDDYHLIFNTNSSFTGTTTDYTATEINDNVVSFAVPISSLPDSIYMAFGTTPISPGGQSASLKLWLRADEQTFSDLAAETPITTGRVRTWRDIGPDNNNVTQATSANQPTLVDSTDYLNFNPLINFDLTDFLLVDRNLDGTSLDGDLSGLSGTSSWEVISVAFTDISGAVGRSILSFGEGTDMTYSFEFFGTNTLTVRDGDGSYGRSLVSGSTVGRNNSRIYNWRHSNNASLDNIGIFTGFDTTDFSGSSNGSDVTNVSDSTLVIGANYSTSAALNQHSGGIGDLLIYSSPRNGTLVRTRIFTYLAAKYGITLSDDYYGSTFGPIWDVGNTGDFDEDICMLIRDEASRLHQKISTSISSNSAITISLDNNFLSPNSSSLRTSELVDTNYFAIGSNGENFTFGGAPDNLRASLSLRLDRTWLVGENGDVAGDNDNLYIQFDLDDINLSSAFDNLNSTDFFLLIDDNDSFDDATTDYSAISLSNNNLVFEIPEDSLENGDYFTLGIDLPGPGGVAGSLILWLKSNTNTFTNVGGTTATTEGNGESVLAWRDNSLFENHMIQSTSSNTPTLSSNEENTINGYPTLLFDGDDYLSVDSNLNGTTGDGDLTGTTDGEDWEIYIVAYTDNSNTSNKTLLNFGDNNNDSTYAFSLSQSNRIRVTDGSGNIEYSTNSSQVFNTKENAKIFNFRQEVNDNLEDIISQVNQISTNTASTSNANNSTLIQGENITIGAQDFGTITNQFEGAIAEVIIYSDTLNNSEQNQVSSYLALKYGIQTEAEYFLDTVSIWDFGNTNNYDNDIAGLMRYDDSRFDQKIATNISDDIVTMALELDFSSSNESTNRTERLDNETYFIWGHNNGSLSFTETIDADTNLNDRVSDLLNRTWLVSEGGNAQNSDGDLYLQFDLSSVSNRLENPGPEDYNLFVSTTEDFSGSSTFLEATSLDSTGTQIDSTGTLIFNRIVFEVPESLLEDGNYFTIGYDSSYVLPIVLLSFNATLLNKKHVFIDWQTASELNSAYFIIQRSQDGFQWEDLVQIIAQGSSSEQSNYTHTDNKPLHLLSYYRLQCVDFFPLKSTHCNR